MHRSVLFSVLAAFLLACSHDSQRENPLDPELTPPVELTVELDSDGGLTTLTWTAYSGNAGFSEYLVLRNEARSTEVDTLARVSAAQVTSYIDAAMQPDQAYEYRVSVVNDQGFEAVSSVRAVEGFSLTAAGDLVATPDAIAGAIDLTWRAYEGPGFESYRVTRRQQGTDQEIVVATVAAAQDTVLRDVDALAGVPYEYSVTVAALGQVLPVGQSDVSYSLTPVAFEDIVTDSRTATASLSWVPYAGPRFNRYVVLRMEEGVLTDTVAVVDDPATPTAIDRGLRGNRDYLYRVDVYTDSNEVASGPTRLADRLHGIVGQWPIAMRGGSRVRLAWVNGTLEATVADTQQVRLLRLDAEGRPVATEDTLFSQPELLLFPMPQLDPSVTTHAVDDEGRRHLLIGTRERLVLLVFSTDGEALTAEMVLMDKAQREGTTLANQVLVKEKALDFSTEFGLDNLEIRSGGQRIDIETFDTEPQNWELNLVEDTSFNVTTPLVRDGVLLARSVSALSGPGLVGLSRQDVGLANDLSVGVDLWFSSDALIQLSLGADRTPLRLTVADDEIDVLSSVTSNFRVDHTTVPWIVNRFTLSVGGGRVRATMESPVLWTDLRPPRLGAAAMANVDGLVSGFFDDDRTAFTSAFTARGRSSSNPHSTDLRVWQQAGEQLVGIVIAEESRVLVGQATVSGFAGTVTWPSVGRADAFDLGAGAGQDDGELIHPLSVDRSHDGRYFVIDAGNDRIQVFDHAGSYVTQWDGFDFGSGNVATDFAGSIAVDDEGFIYVADVGNGVIKKFAP